MTPWTTDPIAMLPFINLDLNNGLKSTLQFYNFVGKALSRFDRIMHVRITRVACESQCWKTTIPGSFCLYITSYWEFQKQCTTPPSQSLTNHKRYLCRQNFIFPNHGMIWRWHQWWELKLYGGEGGLAHEECWWDEIQKCKHSQKTRKIPTLSTIDTSLP